MVTVSRRRQSRAPAQAQVRVGYGDSGDETCHGDADRLTDSSLSSLPPTVTVTVSPSLLSPAVTNCQGQSRKEGCCCSGLLQCSGPWMTLLNIGLYLASRDPCRFSSLGALGALARNPKWFGAIENTAVPDVVGIEIFGEGVLEKWREQTFCSSW